MDKQKAISQLNQELEAAAAQLPLAKKADEIVPGEGDPEADVMLIGEAPGFHEAQQRRPFVGRSGKFLRKTLDEVGLPPKEVWISNIVKVRPPDNRDPSADEIGAYKSFLDKEIEIIDPLLMVTLGRFSMAKFLPDVKISQVHGRLHKVKWNDRQLFVLPMYHPAAGLRSGKVRQSFIDDFNKIEKILEWIEDKQEDVEFEGAVKDALM
jgi:DNA polymerase